MVTKPAGRDRYADGRMDAKESAMVRMTSTWLPVCRGVGDGLVSLSNRRDTKQKGAQWLPFLVHHVRIKLFHSLNHTAGYRNRSLRSLTINRAHCGR